MTLPGFTLVDATFTVGVGTATRMGLLAKPREPSRGQEPHFVNPGGRGCDKLKRRDRKGCSGSVVEPFRYFQAT